MANTSANYRIKLAAVLDTKTINQQINQLNKNNTLKELKIKVTISDASLKKIKELNDLLNKTEALNKYTSGLKNIQETMKSYEKIASKVVTASKNTVVATDNIGKAAKNAEPKVKSFGDKAADAFKKFSLWSAVSSIFYQVVNAAKRLVDTAIELDSAFTELQKVTDLTMDDFDKITEKAYNLGSEVAKTTTEAINAMTEFAKAGYSVEESTDILAKNALMWTNIADGTVDASESANMIISVMKAFNIEAENTTHIIDALNEVSNNFAVSSGDLSDSLTKSSAVLANAGVTFEEQLGLITAGTEVLRNANIVSNGLKTISLRLQGMEEDGEAVDGLSAKLESSFNKLGLTLYDVDGSLKDTYDILADLAKVYPGLTEAEKAYYTELIAGKNRAQVAAAILNNFSIAIEATETAMNSAGSATEENAKVLDSLKGHIQALKTEWESLVNSKDLQDFIKILVDMATMTIKLIKAFGGLKTILMQIGVYLVITKWNNLVNIIIKLNNAIKTVSYSLTLFYQTSKTSTQALITMSDATLLLKTRMGLLIGAITIGIAAINGIKQKIEEWQQAQKEKRQELIESSKEISNYTKEIIDLYSKYEKLSALTERSEEEENSYASAIRNLAEALGYKTDAIDDATIKQQGYLDTLKETYKQELLNKRAELAASGVAAKKELEDSRTKTYIGALKDRQQAYNTYPMMKNGLDEFLFLTKQVQDIKDSYNEAINSMSMTKEKADKKFFDSYAYKTYSEELADIQPAAEAFLDNQVQQALIEAQLQDALPKTVEEQENFAKSIARSLGVTDKYESVLVELVKKLLPDFQVQNQDSAEDIKYQDDALSNFTKKVQSAAGAYKNLSDAINEYNEYGFISTDTLLELIEEYPQYLKYLEEENGKLKLNEEGLELRKKELIENSKAALAAQLQADLHANSLAQEKAEAERDFKALMDLKFARQDIWDDYEASKKALDDAINNIFKDVPKKATKTADQWKEAFTTAYNSLKNKRDRDLIDTETYINELSALNKKYFEGNKKYAEEYEKYLLEIYKETQNLFKEMVGDLEHEVTMLENQGVDKSVIIDKYREIQDELHRQAKYYREQGLAENNDLIQDLQEQWWVYNKKIEDMQEDIKDDITDRFEKIRDVAIDIIDDQIKAQEDWLDAENKRLEAKIEGYEAELDALEEEEDVENRLLKIEEARKKLAEAKNKKVRIYREGKGFVYESDFDAVSEAQSELDSLLEEWDLFQEKSKISDIIAQLEAEKEANKKRVDEEIEALNKLKDEWDKSLDLSEDIENYKTYLEELGEEEQNSFDKRLQAVKDFTAAYKAEMATLNSTTTTTDTSATSGISNYASGQRGSGKDSYNVYTDYQKLLNEAIASGAPADHLAYLERKRNNKIDGEGLDYEKTYNYQYVPNKSGSSSSSSKKSSSGSSHSPVSQPAAEKSSGSSLKSTVTSVIKSVGNALKSITGLASGTESADGLAHFVGEGGPELYVPPKGSGIIPNPATTNLMAWGAINPMNLVRSVMGNENNTNIKIDNITLPNVKDADSFIEELKNFKSFAIQKQSVRR